MRQTYGTHSRRGPRTRADKGRDVLTLIVFSPILIPIGIAAALIWVVCCILGLLVEVVFE